MYPSGAPSTDPAGLSVGRPVETWPVEGWPAAVPDSPPQAMPNSTIAARAQNERLVGMNAARRRAMRGCYAEADRPGPESSFVPRVATA
jgi:hypothetical protein